MKQLEKSIFIDALSLVPRNKSGVGITLKQTLEKLANEPELKIYNIYLVVPLWKEKYLTEYLTSNIKLRTLPLPAKGLELLLRLKLMPPIDWFLGSGVYVFPNYRNWPLWYSRSITYIYDLGYLLYPETVQVKNQRYLKKYMNIWAGRSDKIATISSQVHDEVSKYLSVPYTKLGIVYCGVTNAKQKYDIDYDKYFLYVGNIEPRKNLIALLDAYSGLPRAVQDEYGLVLIGGDGWLNQTIYDRLEKLQANQKNIIKVKKFVGEEDLPAIYSGASALVHPAIYEGFGMTPLEAMACGVPVAVSDIASIKEVVQDSGYYFDPMNVKSITQAMEEVVFDKSNYRASRINRGLSRAGELTWDNSARSLYELIEQLFNAGAHSKPILRRVYSLYKTTDQKIRDIFGEKILSPYKPGSARTSKELMQSIYNDYNSEQPLYIQKVLLRIYLVTKSIIYRSLSRIYGAVAKT
jgi:glycosyltransferase involved in cell wall biosynthesis